MPRPSKRTPLEARTKKCKVCQKEQPISCFYKNNQQADGRMGKCRDCTKLTRKASDHAYNLSEKGRANARRYYYSKKGQIAKRAYREAYKPTREQEERYRLAGRLHELEQKYKIRRKRYDQSVKGKAMKAALDKRYAGTEKGKFSKRKTEIKRKYQIKTAECTLTREQWQEIKQNFGHACAYCGKVLERLEMDHVIPLSKGGTHTKENIVPACRKCNAKKGAGGAMPFVVKVLSKT